MDFGSMMSIAKTVGQFSDSGMNILQGIGAWASVGDIGREKKKILQLKADYNKKQIADSFKKNYAIQMSKYANQLSDISIQRNIAENDILKQATQNIGAVDIQGSSYKNLAFSTLNNEFNSEMNKLIDNHINNNLSLASKNIEMEKEIELGQAMGNITIDSETDNAKAQAIGQVIEGITLGLNTYVSNKADKESKEKTSQNLKDFDEKLKAPDYNDKYFTNQVKDWFSATKSKNMGMNPISYMSGGGKY